MIILSLQVDWHGLAWSATRPRDGLVTVWRGRRPDRATSVTISYEATCGAMQRKDLARPTCNQLQNPIENVQVTSNLNKLEMAIRLGK